MTDALVPLGTAVIAALAALSGATLGPMVTARRQHKQWLRDRRSDVLEDLYMVSRVAQSSLRAYSLIAKDFHAPTEPLERLGGEVERLRKKLSDAASRAEIYSSSQMTRAIRSVSYVYPGLVDFGFALMNSPSEFAHRQDYEVWKRSSSEWADAVDDLLHRLREDLGVG